MGKVLDFVNNKKELKIRIFNYSDNDLDIVNIPDKFYGLYGKKHLKDDFHDKMYAFIWNKKVSELLIIIYLEAKKGIYHTIYALNQLLHRTKQQYPATLKNIKRLRDFGIIKFIESPRNGKKVFINDGVLIYGEDEFRRWMVEEWDSDAKEYVKRNLVWYSSEKAKTEQRIKCIKKAKRVKNESYE